MSALAAADPMVVAAVERLFADQWPLGTRLDPTRQARLWGAVAAAGWPWVSVPESAGGSGGTLADAAAILRAAGRSAVPLPIAETGLLAGWLLASAGLPVGEHSAAVVLARGGDGVTYDGSRLSGMATRVPWARSVHHLVVLVERGATTLLCRVPSDLVTIEPVDNLAGEPRDAVTFPGIAVEAHSLPDGVDGAAFVERAALSRVLLMAGALERMAHLTVAYTGERQQFGRPVRKFQAVQAHLVAIAQDAALVGMAADLAVDRAEHERATFEIGSAKLLANQAAARATRAAHQAHGAIGMTEEYPLHQLSRRLWAWRMEYGTERDWSRRIGVIAAAAGAGGLYPLIADGPAPVGS